MLAEIVQTNAEWLENFKTKVCWHDLAITIPDQSNKVIKQKIENFCDKMHRKDQSGSYYSEQRRASSAFKDIKVGKYGEFAATICLQSYGFPKTLPDLTIRSKFEKNWDFDLPFGDDDPLYPSCHVKTCDYNTTDLVRSRGSDYSWTFQKSNPNGLGGRDKLFDNPDSPELILFVYIDCIYSKKARLVASAPWNLLQGILSDPVMPKYLTIKKCIYSSDLLSLARKA